MKIEAAQRLRANPIIDAVVAVFYKHLTDLAHIDIQTEGSRYTIIITHNSTPSKDQISKSHDLAYAIADKLKLRVRELARSKGGKIQEYVLDD